MKTFAMPQPADNEYQFAGKTISIPVKYIITAAYLYMVVPIAIFFVTWLRWYFGIPATVILFLGGWKLLKETVYNNSDALVLPVQDLIIIGTLVFFWNYSMSYFFYQTWDQIGRNAVLRDMCNYTWPIYYEGTGYAHVYYLVHWIVPALVGKLLGYTAANVALLIWNSIGVFGVFVCICVYFHPQKRMSVWTIFLLLVIWSALNEIGYMLVYVLGQTGYTLGSGFGWSEAYGYGYQYTPNDQLLAWVYNQTIVPWLGIVLALINPQIRNYAYLGLCVLPYGPIPFVGLFFYLIIDFFSQIHTKKADVIKEAFSIQNICAIITIFPTFFLYFRTNVSGQQIGIYEVPNMFDAKHLTFMAVFYLLEFGIYGLIIHEDYKKSLLFNITIWSLVIIPHIQIGYGRDFCMRASIPALFILMILVMRYVILHGDEKLSKRMVLLIICLSVSGLGTVKDIAVRIKACRDNNWNAVVAADIGTFADKTADNFELGAAALYSNLVPDYEKTAFFKYLARPLENAKVSKDLVGIAGINDLTSYLDFLSEKDVTVFIAVQDIQGFSMRQEHTDKLKGLGFSDNVDRLLEGTYHSFIGIVKNGEIVTEQIGGDEHISYSGEPDGYSINMESATLNTGNFSTINISGQEYSSRGRGLNIVVRDNLTGCVIDSVSFDTHVEKAPCVRMEELLCR